MYHSGVFFATLVVQLAMANGLPFSHFSPREDCSGCGEDDDVEEVRDNDFVINSRQYYRRKEGKGDCDDGQSCSTSPAATSPSVASTTSQTNASTTSQSTTSMTTTSSTTSNSVTPTAAPLIAATSHSTITTGGIVGAAFGSDRDVPNAIKPNHFVRCCISDDFNSTPSLSSFRYDDVSLTSHPRCDAGTFAQLYQLLQSQNIFELYRWRLQP
ncbi:hypothetical protein BJ912DRAFT_922797 [Pholiota molesta]|nr:hypothetical protein BJ912DRAFT_922797 [Pholiota molesta]